MSTTLSGHRAASLAPACAKSVAPDTARVLAVIAVRRDYPVEMCASTRTGEPTRLSTHQLIAVDISAAASHATHSRRHEVLCADLETLDAAASIRSRRFDVILLKGSAKYLRNLEGAFQRLVTTLTPSGVVVAALPALDVAVSRRDNPEPLLLEPAGLQVLLSLGQLRVREFLRVASPAGGHTSEVEGSSYLVVSSLDISSWEDPQDERQRRTWLPVVERCWSYLLQYEHAISEAQGAADAQNLHPDSGSQPGAALASPLLRDLRLQVALKDAHIARLLTRDLQLTEAVVDSQEKLAHLEVEVLRLREVEAAMRRVPTTPRYWLADRVNLVFKCFPRLHNWGRRAFVRVTGLGQR